LSPRCGSTLDSWLKACRSCRARLNAHRTKTARARRAAANTALEGQDHHSRTHVGRTGQGISAEVRHCAARGACRIATCTQYWHQGDRPVIDWSHSTACGWPCESRGTSSPLGTLRVNAGCQRCCVRHAHASTCQLWAHTSTSAAQVPLAMQAAPLPRLGWTALCTGSRLHEQAERTHATRARTWCSPLHSSPRRAIARTAPRWSCGGQLQAAPPLTVAPNSAECGCPKRFPGPPQSRR
jgi:hypothetical protein